VDEVQKQGQAPTREQQAGSMQQDGLAQHPTQSGPQHVSADAVAERG